MSNPVFGFDVVQYDGTNAEAIVQALGFKRGDAVVRVPGRPMMLRASVLEEIIENSREGTRMARDLDESMRRVTELIEGGAPL